MDIDNATYDASAKVTLIGREGLFKGEETVIHVGQCVTVGRSRMCEVSVARTAECVRLGKEAMERHKSYRKISRKHFRVCFVNAMTVEVEDLSTNGTLVNGHRIDRLQISGFRPESQAIRIEFGEGELLTVEPSDSADLSASEEKTEYRDIRRFSEDLDKTPIP